MRPPFTLCPDNWPSWLWSSVAASTVAALVIAPFCGSPSRLPSSVRLWSPIQMPFGIPVARRHGVAEHELLRARAAQQRRAPGAAHRQHEVGVVRGVHRRPERHRDLDPLAGAVGRRGRPRRRRHRHAAVDDRGPPVDPVVALRPLNTLVQDGVAAGVAIQRDGAAVQRHGVRADPDAAVVLFVGLHGVAEHQRVRTRPAVVVRLPRVAVLTRVVQAERQLRRPGDRHRPVERDADLDVVTQGVGAPVRRLRHHIDPLDHGDVYAVVGVCADARMLQVGVDGVVAGAPDRPAVEFQCALRDLESVRVVVVVLHRVGEVDDRAAQDCRGRRMARRAADVERQPRRAGDVHRFVEGHGDRDRIAGLVEPAGGGSLAVHVGHVGLVVRVRAKDRDLVHLVVLTAPSNVKKVMPVIDRPVVEARLPFVAS